MADEQHDDREIVKVVEESLASLAPRPSRIDRDRLMYLAGRASRERELKSSSRLRLLWPAAACLSSAAALFALLLMKPVENSVEEVAETETNVKNVGSSIEFSQGGVQVVNSRDRLPPAPPLPNEPNYLQLRSFALAYGVEAMPYRWSNSANSGGAPREELPPTRANLMREWMQNDVQRSSPSGAG